jgi:hypothetical protein
MTTELATRDDSFDEFILPTQCVARSKQSGNQCSKQAIPGGTVCRYHGGKAPQVQAKAVARLTQARDMALDRLIEQLEPPENEFSAIEVKDLLAVVDKLTAKVQLLSGEATDRREDTRKHEVRVQLEQELDALRARSLGGIDASVIDVEPIEKPFENERDAEPST